MHEIKFKSLNKQDKKAWCKSWNTN